MNTTATPLARYDHYIDGRFEAPASGQYFDTENPFTGKTWAQIARGNADDADRAVLAARRAFDNGPWRRMTATQRGALLRKLGDLITEKSKFLAEIEVRDNGKLYAEMSAQTADMAQW